MYRWITVHAAATSPSMDIGASDINRWHLDRGWNGIGYAKVIRRDGTVEDGRPADQQGAHVGGFNRDPKSGLLNLGVCMAGGLKEGTKIPEDNFTDEQYTSLTKLLTQMRMEYSTFDIMGHNEFPGHEARGCPCFNIDAYRTWITRAWEAFYLPLEWYDHSKNSWKEGLNEEWNETNIYKEVGDSTSTMEGFE